MSWPEAVVSLGAWFGILGFAAFIMWLVERD